MTRLEGKVALVTGATRGLGLDIAARFVAEGAHVCIGGRDAALGRDMAQRIGASFEALDVTDEAQWQAALHAVEQRHGALHILVNNAGVSAGEVHFDPETTLLEDWRRTFAVNADGVFLGCKHAIPIMTRSGGGSIINLSSVGAMICTPFITAYGASKAAVAHLSRSVALHCAQKGTRIRCNTISPGEVVTQMMTSHWDKVSRAENIPIDQLKAGFLAMIPMGEFQDATDISSAAVFLASDEARFITGINLTVDGGITLK